MIIFLWFRNIGGETCTKFQGQNIELVCGDVEFFADYDSDTGEVYISNTGNVPIFGMNVQINQIGNYNTLDITSLSGEWPGTGLNQGGVYTSEDISFDVGNADSIVLTPILRGSCGGAEKSYACNVNQHGYEIAIF